MQPNKKFFGVKLTSLLSLLVLLSLSGCLGCGGPNKKKDLVKNPKAIILFHGINDQGNLKSLEDKLAKDFPDAKVIALDRDNSASAPITQQAQEAFEALKKQDLLGRDLVLFGNSQGGLLAFSLYDQYKTQLNVKGIITDCTPWEGAPVANATPLSISQLALEIAQELKKQAGKITLAGLSPQLSFMVNTLDKSKPEYIAEFIEVPLQSIFKDFTKGPGGQDLKPDSQFLKDIATNLPTSQISILALAGTDVDLNIAIPALMSQQEGNTGGINPILAGLVSLVKNKQISFNEIKDAWGKFITNNKQPYNAHDFIVPRYSAQAKNISNKPASFQMKAFKGYSHFTGIAIPEASPIYDIVVETIKQYFVQTDTGKIKKPKP